MVELHDGYRRRHPDHYLEDRVNTSLLTKLRSKFVSYDWTPDARRRYMRQWIRSVSLLGDKYLLHRSINVKELT